MYHPPWWLRQSSTNTVDVGTMVLQNADMLILGSVVFNQLLHMKGIPFPWTVRIAGFIMIPLSIVCILTVRPAIKSKTFPLSAASEQEKGHEDIKDESQKIKNCPFYTDRHSYCFV